MLRSGYVKRVRAELNIGSDEFFRIASDWCDTGAKIKKDEDGFIITLKGLRSRVSINETIAILSSA
jgi:hypothetical protein